jgi:tetratricopeptide (TPR) repeat protein
MSTSAFFYLGVIYEKAREYNPAIAVLKQCLTMDQEHFGAAIHLATLLANTNDNKKSAKYFRHAQKI